MTRYVCFVLSLAISVASTFADQSPAPKRANNQAPNQTALQKAQNKQRELWTKYQAAEREAFKGSEFDQLRKASEAATAALNKKIEELSVKERQAEKAARDALSAAIAKLVEESKEIADLKAKTESLQKQRRDLNFEIGLIQTRLNHPDSPLQQELDIDADLQKLRQSGYKGSRAERSEALSKYFTARRDKLANLKAAKPLLSKIEQLQKQIVETEKDRSAAYKAIVDARRKIEYGKDESLKPLRDKLSSAQAATRKVYSHSDAEQQRAAARKASGAYYKKRTELTAGSKELTNLRQQLNAVYKEIRELQPKPKTAPKKAQKEKAQQEEK